MSRKTTKNKYLSDLVKYMLHNILYFVIVYYKPGNNFTTGLKVTGDGLSYF